MSFTRDSSTDLFFDDCVMVEIEEKEKDLNKASALPTFDDCVIVEEKEKTQNSLTKEKAGQNKSPAFLSIENLPVKSVSLKEFEEIPLDPADTISSGNIASVWGLFSSNKPKKTSFHEVKKMTKISKVIPEAICHANLDSLTYIENYNRTNQAKVPHKKKPETAFQKRFLTSSFDIGSYSFEVINPQIPRKATSPTTEKSKFYLKINTDNSIMTDLEAAACHCYRLLAPDVVPESVCPVYDPGKNNAIIGVISKALEFEPLSKVPLTERELKAPSLTKFHVPELYEIYKKAIKEKIDLEKLSDPMTTQNLEFHCKHTNRKEKISTEELYNFETVKKLTTSLILSYIFKEDDNHANNYGKRGRIDFDMSFWELFYNFKEGNAVDWAIRQPAERLKFNAEDIKNFPNLIHSKPFYWPAQESSDLFDKFAKLVSPFIDISKNVYSKDCAKTFQKLSDNKIVFFFKYFFILKFILMDESMFRSALELYMRKNIAYKNNIKIIDLFTNHIKELIESLKTVMKNSPDFYNNFIEPYGAYAANNIIAEFEAANEIYAQEILEIENKLNNKSVYRNTQDEELLLNEKAAYEKLKIDNAYKLIGDRYLDLVKTLKENCNEPTESIAFERPKYN